MENTSVTREDMVRDMAMKLSKMPRKQRREKIRMIKKRYGKKIKFK